jgi:hypothetical protein
VARLFAQVDGRKTTHVLYGCVNRRRVFKGSFVDHVRFFLFGSSKAVERNRVSHSAAATSPHDCTHVVFFFFVAFVVVVVVVFFVFVVVIVVLFFLLPIHPSTTFVE